QAGTGVQGRRQQEWEDGKTKSQDDASQCQGREQQSQQAATTTSQQGTEQQARKTDNGSCPQGRPGTIVSQPGTFNHIDRLANRCGHGLSRPGPRQAIAIHGPSPPAAGSNSHKGQHDQRHGQGTRTTSHMITPLPGNNHRTLESQHQNAEQTTQNGKGLEQTEEVALVHGTQRGFVKAEGYAQHDVPNSHAKHQSTNQTGSGPDRVPVTAPARRAEFAAVLDGHRANNQGDQKQHHGQVKARESHGIQQRPGRKGHTTGHDQPNLVTFPD